jgi:hypothetical protein
MKPSKNRLKKRLLIAGSILIGGFVLIILCISPITKYLVEKYSVKYTGRQIKMNWAYVNPFTGYVHFGNLRIYEARSDSIFFSTEGLSMNFAMLKLLTKTYEISTLTLDKPKGIIILAKRSDFNFNDLITRFAPSPADSAKPPVHFNLLKLEIKNGIFCFRDTLIGVNYSIKDMNFECSGKRWDRDTTTGKFSFSSGIGTGDMSGEFTINFKNLNYRYTLLAHKYSLDVIEQYLKDIINYGTFSANLDADIKAKGNFMDEENLDMTGRIVINDFHFGKTRNEDYLSFDKFVMAINKVNPKEHIYNIDSLVLTHPYFKYEKYDHLDNIETMFGANAANVTAKDEDHQRFNLVLEIAHYLINVSKNFFQSPYKINKVALNRGDIRFNDYSNLEKFSIAAGPLYIVADSVDKNKSRIKISLRSGIKPYGEALVSASINPRNNEDFDVAYTIQKLPVTMFNPYFIMYTSYPLDRGTIELNGWWKVRNNIIASTNHLVIIDPRVAKRVRNKAARWIPMWLVMAFVRERGNVIDYQIPITGSLKNPTYHLHDIIFGILSNIFIKPPTTPYIMKVRMEERTIEKSLTFNWKMRQSSIQPNQERFIKKIVDYIEKTPGASIVIYPEQYAIKEKEYILFFEAKRKYFLSNRTGKDQFLSEADSELVDKMSVKDPLFIKYLDKHRTHDLIFTIQDKCSSVINPLFVNSKYEQLNRDRKNTFLHWFKEKGVSNKITFAPSEGNIPYNGFSYYKIAYKGELPDFLTKAYNKMDELNGKVPREKYKEERKKIKIGSGVSKSVFR